MTTPTSATGQAPSFKTNVNRAKTKRWVEAKSYSYDGDDWGDVDDYDEYPGYDEPEPLTKPTGFRQRGQSSSSGGMSGQGQFNPDVYQSPTSLEGPSFSHQAPQSHFAPPRHVTNPPPQGMVNPAQRNAETLDNRRAFSAGPARQGLPGFAQAPNERLQNTEAHDFQSGPGHSSQQSLWSPVAHQSGSPPKRQNFEGPYVIASGAQSGGQDRVPPRDQGTSLAAATDNLGPPSEIPLRTKPPPLQTGNSPSPSTDPRPPPRKSSLGQQNQPSLPFDPNSPPSNSIPLDARERAGSSSSARSAPFVRPADIYKRVEAERERERQSQDNTRPNMDELMETSSEHPTIEQKGLPGPEQHIHPALGPVTEHKSEYGLENVGQEVKLSTERGDRQETRRTTSKTFEIPRSDRPPASHSAALSPGLSLPDPTRMSGFGEGFGESFMRSPDSERRPLRPEQPYATSTSNKLDLHHTPSKGFTSVVHQAFDTAQDQVPPTPSSTADSSVARSSSGGTNAVSPIMSRGPSAIDRDRGSELPTIDDITTPTNSENAQNPGLRQRSSSPFRAESQPVEPDAQHDAYSEAPPPNFKMGHRRSSSTPSPDNSPAKVPTLASMSHLRHAEAVDMAHATPTPTESVPSTSSSVKHSAPPSPSKRFDAQRPDSAASGRVKDLAKTFESSERPDSAQSNTTPRASVIEAKSSDASSPNPARPGAERVESFRPQLPGGWQSSMSIQHASTPAFGSKTNLSGLGLPSQGRNITEEASRIHNEGSSNATSSNLRSVNVSPPQDTRAINRRNEATPDQGDESSQIISPKDSDRGDISTPLAKDTPRPLRTESPSSPYFMNAQSQRPSNDNKAQPNVRQPSSLPPLSTDVRPGEYESDRLRREIVRELSPGMRSDPTTATSDSPHQPSSRYPTNESLGSRGQSGGLPSEYDSYWNDDSEDAASASSAELGNGSDATAAQKKVNPAMGNDAHNQVSLSREGSQEQPPASVPSNQSGRRFSWEQPLEDLAKKPQPSRHASKDDYKSGIAGPLNTTHSSIQPQAPLGSQKPDPRIHEPVQEPVGQNDVEGHKGIPELDSGTPVISRPYQEPFTTTELEDTIMLPDDRKVGPTATDRSSRDSAIHRPFDPPNQRRSSERGDEEEVKQADASRHVDQLPAAPPASGAIPKLPAFREIMSLKTPQERIRAFSETQHEFATLNTGLAHWLALTVNSLPEHSDLASGRHGSAWPTDNKTIPPAPGFHGQPNPIMNRQSSAHGAPLQGNTGVGPQVAGGSGKMSTQQVQAKGKEFLHTAGVFSGKANVAAKGLFSKGKSKLRDASGSKKASTKPLASSSPTSRGMQAQQTAPEPPISNNRSTSHRNEAESEQEAPSVQSLNQSQLADDECSTESDRLPRSSKIFRKLNSYEKRRSKSREHSVVALTGNEPKSVLHGKPEDAHQQDTKESYDRLEQADLRGNRHSEQATSPPTPIQSHGLSGTRANLTTSTDIDHDTPSPSQLSSPHEAQAIKHRSSSGYTPASSHFPVQPQDIHSRSTLHVESGPRSLERSTTGSLTSNVSNNVSRLQLKSSTKASEDINDKSGDPKLLSPSQAASGHLNPEGHPWDADLDQPSPISPSIPVQAETPPRGRRVIPVHYGVEHNFMPPTTVERERRRSQSFSRPFNEPHSRSRSRSPHVRQEFARRPSAEEVAMPIGFYPEDLQDGEKQHRHDPSKAFTNEHKQSHQLPTEDITTSPSFYPQTLTREEALIPRHLASEYALEGVGPPDIPPKDGKAQSRRGSRGSAFFKSLTKSFTDSDSPSGPQSAVDRFGDSPAASSTNIDNRSKRSSIFGMRRSRTDVTTANTLPKETPPSNADLISQEYSTNSKTPSSVPPSHSVAEEDEFPMRPRNRTSSGFGKRFQRSTTSAGDKSTEGGKKNRLSAIGNLFTRHSSRRKGSLEQWKGPAHYRSESQPLPPMPETSNDHRDAGIHNVQYGHSHQPTRSVDQEPFDGYYSPRRIRSPPQGANIQPASQPASQPFADVNVSNAPAYVQDSSLRQHASPPPSARSKQSSRGSLDFFRKMSQGSSLVKADVQRHDKKDYSNRFSNQNAPQSQNTAFDKGNSRGTRSTDYSGAPTLPSPGSLGLDTHRMGSPPPPPPPPKDDWHRATPRRSSLAATNTAGHQLEENTQVPSENPTAGKQFSGLPPLQTSFAPIGPIQSGMTSPPTDSARPMTYEEKRRSRQLEIESGSFNLSKASMSPQEKRRSRQWEIESSHLSPDGGKSANPSRRPTGIRKAREDDKRSDHEVRMSATSFPGQEWTPHGHHQYAWLGDA